MNTSHEFSHINIQAALHMADEGQGRIPFPRLMSIAQAECTEEIDGRRMIDIERTDRYFSELLRILVEHYGATWHSSNWFEDRWVEVPK